MVNNVRTTKNEPRLYPNVIFESYDKKFDEMKKYGLILSFKSTKDMHPELNRVPLPDGVEFQDLNPPAKVNSKKIADTSINPNWNVSLYNQERIGASTIFNFGKNKDMQSASLSTDALIGVKVTEDENKGFFFDSNVGLRYDVGLEKASPNRHRGGIVGNLTLGYKMPVYDGKNTSITFDTYATGSGYYCSSGKNALDAFGRAGFVSGTANEGVEEKAKLIMSQFEKFLRSEKVVSDAVYVKRKNFDNSTTEYSSFDLHAEGHFSRGSDFGAGTDPRFNPYGLKGGIGTGFTFNINPDGSDDNQLSIYLGAEAGVHKTGPKFEIDTHNNRYLMYHESYFEEYKDFPMYTDGKAIVVDMGLLDKSDPQYYHYESNVHEDLLYFSGKMNVTYAWDKNSRQKEVSLNVDEHGAFIDMKVNLWSNEFDGKTNHRKK